MKEKKFEIRCMGKGPNNDYLEECGERFLTMQEPYMEVEPIGYASPRSCHWSLKVVFIRTGLDNKIVPTIRDGVLYLVRKEFEEDFNNSFVKHVSRKATTVEPKVEIKTEPTIINVPVERTNKEILRSLRELWKVGYDNKLIEERSIKGHFYETLLDIINPLNTKLALKNFEDYMCLVFGNATSLSDIDLDYVLTYAVNKKLKEI